MLNMKESYEYPNPSYPMQLSPSFDYFLFGLNYHLKELSQIKILGTF